MKNRQDLGNLRLSLTLVLLLGFILSGCGHGDETPREFPVLSKSLKSKYCRPSKSSSSIPERQFLGQRYSSTVSFNELRDSIRASCKDCHQAPANSQGITYIDSFEAEERTIGGITQVYPGLSEMAEKFASAILTPDSGAQKQMPPAGRRNSNPAGFLRIGHMIQSWIDAGKPNGPFTMGSVDGSAPAPNAPFVDTTDVGDCIPDPSIMGFDYRRDRQFAEMTELPKSILDTDLFSLDAFDLAQKGTVAYNVEYPLWADNAEKGRWVHVPMKEIDGNRLERQSIQYVTDSSDPLVKKKFQIPENTRFYKNFYKQIKQANGKPRFRRIETRIIVVRYPAEKALFGTYRWDETEQVATLVETPRRDGSVWKDSVFTVTTDEKKGTQRKYAIPGKHRCVECHMGAENKSFVLGFTPLQVNRRAPGEYARNQKVTPDELSLAERLAVYGVVGGYIRAEELPRLEAVGVEHFRNIFEFKAQAYMVGNCAHCHNPNGFAAANGINLTFSPGGIYNFNPKYRSQERSNLYIVNSGGDEDRSYIYSKVARPASEQGITSRMPMHTPATPDCNLLQSIGKWIKSYESIDAAREWEPECKPASDDFDWVVQDFTWPKSDHYVPRRDDWADPTHGMPQKFRDLEFTPSLQELVNRNYAVGWWNEKDECKFPAVDFPVGDSRRKPWMVDDDGKPKAPNGFGQVYYTTPGSWYFRNTCFKCHGERADGTGDLARGLLNWSGGEVQVANLIDGLFGNRNQNLSTFDVSLPGGTVRNLGGNYLIWMAMEGTKVQFPPEASNFIGRHGAQMLNKIRDNCLKQISPEMASSPNYPEHEIYRDVCFYGNWAPDDPRLKFDPDTALPVNPEAVETWLDRAAYNAGWAIFQYIKDGSAGNWRPGNNECEKVYPNTGGHVR